MCGGKITHILCIMGLGWFVGLWELRCIFVWGQDYPYYLCYGVRVGVIGNKVG